MKILVLNCGSSSVKYKLYDMDGEKVLAKGGVERVGIDGSFLKFKDNNGESVVIEKPLPEHTVAVELILSTLTDPKYGTIKSFDEINAVGHRMVHGGEVFKESTLITDEVTNTVKSLTDLAPLHNPANLKGVAAISKLLPKVPQVAVFDTAFLSSMEPYAYIYPIPYRYYRDYKVRRYGFHGTSHRYVSLHGAKFLGLDYNKSKIITCHIGNGASITAIKDGKAIDTTLGMTPLEGLMMGSRSGDVDPGALTFIMEKEHLSAHDLSEILNKKSGVMGVMESDSGDMRDVESAMERGDERAILTMNMYNHRIKKYVGAFLAELNGADAIIFTGGVGENQAVTREYVCEHMEYAGIKLDKELNAKVRGKDVVISTPDSKVKVAIIPTDEELLIARDTLAIVTK